MTIQAIASAALIATCGFYSLDVARAQGTDSQSQPTNNAQIKSGEMSRECEAVEHTPGQQKVVDGKEDLSPASKEKTAQEINKEIIAAMIEKDSGKSGGTKPQSSDDKTAKEINKEIVDNTKKTESGLVVAETGAAKPVENWFGCPQKK